MPTFDDRDREILDERRAAYFERKGIQSGDFVRFSDGTLRRVSHVWTDEQYSPEIIQTSGGGDMSFYLGKGYMSFSGSLHPGLDAALFTPTDELMDGYAWFFHHDMSMAHNGVNVTVPCRVWLANCLPN